MNFKLKLMLGMLMLLSVIFLGRCRDEDGTISINSSQKSYELPKEKISADSSQKSFKESRKNSFKESRKKYSEILQGPKHPKYKFKLGWRLLKKLKSTELPIGEEVTGVEVGKYAIAIGKNKEGHYFMWVSENKVSKDWTSPL